MSHEVLTQWINSRLICAVATLSSCVFFFSGCTREEVQAEVSEPIRASCFDVAEDNGGVHLLFGEAEGKKQPLHLFWKRVDTLGSGSPPVPIPTSHAEPGGHHRGNDPQVAARGDRLMALWTAKGGGPYGSGRIATALSDDGGKTWRPGPSPVASGGREDVGYRFPATAADARGFHVVWIHAEDKERSLRYSRLDFGSDHWSDPRTIDATSCACCWNELKVSPDGKLFALYRDDDPKDMALAVSEDGGMSWEQRPHVGEFHWKFDGCPHVGGGLALATNAQSGTAVFATVWSGDPQHLGAYSLNSDDAGMSWSPSAKLSPSGGRHTDTAAISSIHAAVVWDQQEEGRETVYLKITDNGGKTWSLPQRLSSPNAKASYPRVVATRGEYLVLWSESDDQAMPMIKTTRVPR